MPNGCYSIETVKGLKEKFESLYQNKKAIHVSLIDGRKRVSSAKSVIKGVYERFICVESQVNNYQETFTISYSDIIGKRVLIDEIDKEANA